MLCESVVRRIDFNLRDHVGPFCSITIPYRTPQPGMFQGVGSNNLPVPEGCGVSESEFWTRTRTRTSRPDATLPAHAYLRILHVPQAAGLLMPLAIPARVIPTKHTVQCGRQNKGPKWHAHAKPAIPRRKPKRLDDPRLCTFWRPGGEHVRCLPGPCCHCRLLRAI